MLTTLKAAFPGLIATLLGIGFTRFSFTPVAALMVEQSVLSSDEITLIAGFIMGGYALGAFGAHRVSRVFGSQQVVRFAFVVIVAGLAVEALTGGFWSVGLARFVISIAGAFLMVLGPGMILASVEPARRGVAAGIIFTGVGIGVIVAGSVVAALSSLPVAYSGWALVVVCVVAVFAGWGGWPQVFSNSAPVTGSLWSWGFAGLFGAYFMDAMAFIPHTVYLSDYVSSELGYGAQAGGFYWAVFGIGGVTGALTASGLRALFGPQLSLELVFAVKAVFIIMAGLLTSSLWLAVSAFVVGALVPGVVMLVSTRLADLVGPESLTRGWAAMTGGFAIGQFFGATGMAFGYTIFEHYQPLYLIGGGLQALGLVGLVIALRFIPLQQKGRLT